MIIEVTGVHNDTIDANDKDLNKNIIITIVIIVI